MFDFNRQRTNRNAAIRPVVFSLLAIAMWLSGCANTVNPERNFAPPAVQEPSPELTTPADIARALRSGGYIVYMRHGQTRRNELELEAATRKAGTFSLADCATQRNLSDEGIAESRAAGEQFRRMRLPVAKYASSRYCRVIQTARQFSDSIAYSEALTSDGPVVKQPERIDAVRALLSEKPPAGQNIVLFAHQGIFWEATRLTVQEGWAVVLEPGNFTRVVARIGPGDWARLAEEKAFDKPAVARNAPALRAQGPENIRAAGRIAEVRDRHDAAALAPRRRVGGDRPAELDRAARGQAHRAAIGRDAVGFDAAGIDDFSQQLVDRLRREHDQPFARLHQALVLDQRVDGGAIHPNVDEPIAGDAERHRFARGKRHGAHASRDHSEGPLTNNCQPRIDAQPPRSAGCVRNARLDFLSFLSSSNRDRLAMASHSPQPRAFFCALAASIGSDLDAGAVIDCPSR